MTTEEMHITARAYGEAMRAMCEHCKSGIPVVSVLGDGGAAYETVWHRQENGEYLSCNAVPIHALVDLLVQELPPT